MHRLLIKAFTHPAPDLSPLTCKHFQVNKCFSVFQVLSRSNISTNYRLSETFLNFPEVWSGNFLMYTRWEPSGRTEESLTIGELKIENLEDKQETKEIF